MYRKERGAKIYLLFAPSTLQLGASSKGKYLYLWVLGNMWLTPLPSM